MSEILGERNGENARQEAAEKFRDTILRCRENKARTGFRIVVKRQKDLWEDGLRAGKLFQLQKQRDLAEGVVPTNEAEDDENGFDENGNGILHDAAGIYGTPYGGGKWGKYLRAPNLYFQIMERYGDRFVPLGEIATIRFGVKSGCDAFFMPRDVGQEFLKKFSKLEWNDAPLHTHCKRAEVESGKVKLILAGDGTVHPVEAEYLRPEIHSLMNISRPTITTQVTDGSTVTIPEGQASIPDATDFLAANTVFFRQPGTSGKPVVQPLVLPSRAHAEIVHLVAQHGFHGALRLPKTEKAAHALQIQITKRLAALAATANELARSRTSDEKKAMELAHLLEFWMLRGKPSREAKQAQSAD